MQERLLSSQQGSRQPLGQAVLYFGCRRSDQDYLYGSLLEGWAKAGQLTLFTAFSRQQVRNQATLDVDRLMLVSKLSCTTGLYTLISKSSCSPSLRLVDCSMLLGHFCINDGLWVLAGPGDRSPGQEYWTD